MERFTGGGKSSGKTEEAEALGLVGRLRESGLEDMAEKVVSHRRAERDRLEDRRRKRKAARRSRRKNR